MSHDVGSIETRDQIKTPTRPAVDLPDTDAILAESREIVTQATAPKKKDDPREQNPYHFHFEWKDGRGKLWTGDFENHILTMGERQQVGIIRSRYQAGVPIESLDILTVEINLMVSHMMVSLKVKPDWADDMRDLTNIQLLQAIYEEVASHESIFHGYRSPETEG